MHQNTKEQQIDPLGNIIYGSLQKEDLTFFLAENCKKPFYIEAIGITHPDPNYFIQRRHNDYFVVEFILSGKGQLINNGKSFDLNPGDVYILKPGDSHKYWPDKKHPFEKIWINFFSDIFMQTIKAYSLEDFTVFHCPQCQSMFQELLDYAKNTSISDDICYEVGCILYKILTEAAQKVFNNQTQSTIAKEVKLRLDAGLYEDINMDNIAKEMLISKSQLIREFKKSYNRTPYSYYLNKKILTAKKLITLTDLRINEISELLKFSDGHYFTNIFKDKTGISPIQYRKLIRAEKHNE